MLNTQLCAFTLKNKQETVWPGVNLNRQQVCVCIITSMAFIQGAYLSLKRGNQFHAEESPPDS